jgi:hypothetical protein
MATGLCIEEPFEDGDVEGEEDVEVVAEDTVVGSARDDDGVEAEEDVAERSSGVEGEGDEDEEEGDEDDDE